MIDLSNRNERAISTKQVIIVRAQASVPRTGIENLPQEQALLTEVFLRVFERIVSSLLSWSNADKIFFVVEARHTPA